MGNPPRPGWFGFGFRGFGQALGSELGQRSSLYGPEPLVLEDNGERDPEKAQAAVIEVLQVRPSWSFSGFLTRDGCLLLSGSVSGQLPGCRDLLASEQHLLVLRVEAEGTPAEVQAWAAAPELGGEPLWSQQLLQQGSQEKEPGSGNQTGDPVAPALLPLVPEPGWYVSPRQPFSRPLAPELKAQQLVLGAEHALLLAGMGQVYTWGTGRHGQLGHGALEAELEPRQVEALQGLAMAQVAAGGWHSLCVSEAGDLYVWGWNESGQLALPSRAIAEREKTAAGASGPYARSPDAQVPVVDGDGDPAQFIALQPFPALLDLPGGSEVSKASCGSRHTAVVTRDGELYTWGWGKYGQLGHKNTASLDCPQRVDYFTDNLLRVEAVICGPWNTYVYAVEEKTKLSSQLDKTSL
ncbi:RCC1 domain-containing protein 1 isoform X2 [Monodelphis domestica]|uniref:RCC1 domain-containing protein 1 isoform X2 n=1 Tax=Monodelphis domestica TaxID=13616 RepID=UPI0024E2000A|nr:RCC1 domain-containing protein 1 isoform X2 [Monodelphis domestica]